MLEKQQVEDKIEILENGCVQVRTATRIVEDGEVISSSYHRHVVTPLDDTSKESQQVQDICKVMHTPECIASYKASQVEV